MDDRVGHRPGDSFSVPGLDREALYLSRLSARSALYSDLSLLLEDLEEPLPDQAYREIVIRENKLFRASTAARRKLWKELRSRYLLDVKNLLFAAFWNEWKRCGSEPEKAMTTYVLFALNDRLVADLGTEWLFPHLSKAPSEIRVEDVRHVIEDSAKAHPEVAKWSEDTLSRIARHYMASIRDFGLARGKVRKVTVRQALYGAPVRLLIRALRLTGTRELDLLQARIFRLLALEGPEIIHALSELNQRGELRFRMQADVVELDLEAA